MTNKKKPVYATNLKLARLRWGHVLNRPALEHLKSLSTDFHFSVASGDLLLLNACWYVTHTGLLRLANRRRCRGIHVQPIPEFSEVEETGSLAEPSQPSRGSRKVPPQPANGNYAGPKVRDRLCQIIRQHQLDATLVKSYATDFCGVTTLREATREQVETFVAHLADWAEKDRNALLCQLNSYPPQKEGAA
jgi:hypothetical protein